MPTDWIYQISKTLEDSPEIRESLATIQKKIQHELKKRKVKGSAVITFDFVSDALINKIVEKPKKTVYNVVVKYNMHGFKEGMSKVDNDLNIKINRIVSEDEQQKRGERRKLARKLNSLQELIDGNFKNVIIENEKDKIFFENFSKLEEDQKNETFEKVQQEFLNFKL